MTGALILAAVAVAWWLGYVSGAAVEAWERSLGHNPRHRTFAEALQSHADQVAVERLIRETRPGPHCKEE